MPRPVTIIKIDPEKRLIVRMSIVPSIQGVRRIIGCSKIGHRVLLREINGEKLLVGARIEQPREKKHLEWRIRGCENTVGVGILFGTLNQKMDGMWHCPVDVTWVGRNIVWCEPGEDAPAAEVAEVQGIELEIAEETQPTAED